MTRESGRGAASRRRPVHADRKHHGPPARRGPHNQQLEAVRHRAGQPIGPFPTAWARACQMEGLCGIVLGDLRHTVARNLVRTGVPEQAAKSAAHTAACTYVTISRGRTRPPRWCPCQARRPRLRRRTRTEFGPESFEGGPVAIPRRCLNYQSRGVAQPGSALAWGARGPRFKSGRPDHLYPLLHVRRPRVP